MGTSTAGFSGHSLVRHIENPESFRKFHQDELLNLKTKEEIKEKGQFETPQEISQMMVRSSKEYLPDQHLHILEPSMGSGSLAAACIRELKDHSSFDLSGVEIDEDFYNFSKSFFHQDNIHIYNEDFLQMEPDRLYDFVIANPPYTRHHDIPKQQKVRLQKMAQEQTGIRVSGLSGLYIYFMLLADKWLADNSLSCWIIPQEFLSVNYGKAFREYLLTKVCLKRIHLFDYSSSLFDQALVSSCIVWFTKEKPYNSDILITKGCSCEIPEVSFCLSKQKLNPADKWSFVINPVDIQKGHPSSLGDFFTIKRGIATGDNNFFIVNSSVIEKWHLSEDYLRPILPSPKKLKENMILPDLKGNPVLDEPLFLISTDLAPEILQERHPELWQYLQTGLETVSRKYLCRNRKYWYVQEKRKPPLFFCPYFSRANQSKTRSSFHPILNLSNAVGSNSYLLLYPKEELENLLVRDGQYAFKIQAELEKINLETIESYGRNYGGGLNKLEPGEIRNIPCSNLLKL